LVNRADVYSETAWQYIALAVALVSVLYPLAIDIRDRFASRLFAAYEKLKREKTDSQDAVRIGDMCWNRIETFIDVFFHRQLPALAVFVVMTVIGTLLCLFRVGPLDREQQLLQLYVYMLAYVLWIFWVAFNLIRTTPLQALELVEQVALNLKRWQRRGFDSLEASVATSQSDANNKA
jgi:hypothetical protein